MRNGRIRTYAGAMRQTTREARATVAAFAVIVAVWIVGGFGLAGTDVEVFHTPAWVLGGCVLPWIAAVACAVWLGRRVFADFDLDEVAREGAGKGADAVARDGAEGADADVEQPTETGASGR